MLFGPHLTGNDMSKERDIFNIAIEMDDLKERDAFVEKSCRDDEALRGRVNDLLAFETEARSFLSEEQLAPTRATERCIPGTKIGRFKLLEEIGEGGCGIVYMAEQRQPVRRKVALKIIKPGMDTREVVARFEAERQALAMMDHPNIARVLDGGETEQGRPYFVMELVDGVPITEYCDANRLTAQERLKLFVKVCHAVQHAHQKGIIHRDIKPSNVLVTLHDGEPVPRVIDFGVAKALGHELTDRTLFTRYGQILGTPLYMSPEQAARSDLDVDTRSDIYSLGVVLYELLTGHTPLDKSRIRQAALDEVLRIVRDEEPPTPSTRVSKLRTQGSIVGQQRSTELPRLGKLLRGDIDWIVMRALEKDRKRRFESVGELINDIERHLADEPVSSGPPSALYRAGKFVRRNRIGAVAASAVLCSLVLGMAFAIFGMSRATAEKNNAISSARDAQTVLTLLRHMLATNPDVGRDREFSMRRMLDEFSETLRDLEDGNTSETNKIWVRTFGADLKIFRGAFPNLKEQPQVAAEIHNILGDSYEGLDLMDDALMHFLREYDIWRQIYGTTHQRVGLAAHRVAHVHHVKNDNVAARKYGEIAISVFEDLGDYSQASVDPRSYHCRFLALVGEARRGEEILRRTIDQVTRRREQLEDPEGALLTLRRSLATCLSAQGDEQALSLAKAVLEEGLERHAGPGSKTARVHDLIHYGDCLSRAGNNAEALKHFERAWKLVKDYDRSSVAYIRASFRCAEAHSSLFDYERAVVEWDYLLRGSTDPLDIVASFHHLVLAELNRANFKGAARHCLEMLTRADNAADFPCRVVADFMWAVSLRPQDSGKCRALCDNLLNEPILKSLAKQQPEPFALIYAWTILHGSDPPSLDVIRTVRQQLEEYILTMTRDRFEHIVSLSYHTLALSYAAEARQSESDVDALWRQAIKHQKIAVEWMPKHHLFLQAELDEQMVALLEQYGRPDEARKFLNESKRWREELLPADNIYHVDARTRLAGHILAHAQNDSDFREAEDLLTAYRSEVEQRPTHDPIRSRWRSQMVKLHESWPKPAD